MKAHLITVRNPFDAASAERRVLRRRRRIRALAPRTGRPVVAILNGRPVLRAGWGRRLADGDHLMFLSLPAGGGRGGGSNPLRALLSLGLLFVAGPAAGLLSNALGISAATARLAVVLGGQALINALLPPPRPERPERPGEVWSLTAQGNVARLEQPVPVQYGRMRFAPDLAAAPWADTAGNEQFLYCLYCLGAGDYEVEKIEIGDVALAAFGEVEHEIVPPGGRVTLFPAAVETSTLVSGQELRGRVEASFARSGTTLTVTEENHRRASGQTVRLTRAGEPVAFAAIASVPDEDSWTATVTGWTATGGTLSVESVLGGPNGFPANAAGTELDRIGVDLVWPAGLYATDSRGRLAELATTLHIEARPIGPDDAPLGPWVTLEEVTLRDKTRTPQRRTWVWPRPDPVQPRWAVRAWRTDIRSADETDAHDVQWGALRGYLVEDQDWPPVTLLAMRFRATGNLARQASRQVHVTATRKLPVWDGSAWSAPQPTRSIAWALADLARNAAYGPGLPDAQIDLAGLLALDELWAARGDRLDIRLSEAGSWWEAAQTLALPGRARVFLQNGRLRVVRDGPETIPVALYSQRNIVERSFSIDWLMPEAGSADAVEVRYLDGQTWQPERVLAALTDTPPARPAVLRLDGVTGRDQALREGLYHAAANRYRRRVVRFATELEGFIRLSRTDPVRDSCRESSVVAGLHEQTETSDLQDQELAGL